MPTAIRYNELGVLNVAPLGWAGRHDMVQLCVCDVCHCNGNVYWRNAQWNRHGLGVVGLSDVDCIWLSEESLVATLACTIRVRHAGQGGRLYKQESQGPAMFYYNNVLEAMSGFICECCTAASATDTFPEQVAVAWVRDGQPTSDKGCMMV